MIVAEQSVQADDPEGWAILLGVNGDLTEGMGSNIFIVRDGKLYTPGERYVLKRVSRQMTIDQANKPGIPVIEGDIDLFDAANTDEMFLTSTSTRAGHQAVDRRLHQAVHQSAELNTKQVRQP